MGEQQQVIPVRPRPKPLTVIGVLNILFGASLVAVAWLMLEGMAFNVMSRSPYESMERALEIQADRDHREVIARLEGYEEAAESEAARQLFREERERRQEQGPRLPLGAEMVMMGSQMQTQSFGTWSVISSFTSLLVNLVMIVAGMGLVQRVDWGRRLGLWVSWIKLARLFLLQTIFVVLVVPPFSKQLGDAVTETIAAQGGGGPPAVMPSMTLIYAITYTVWGLAILVLGSIYPIVTLIYLTKPEVRAASLPAEVRARQIMQDAKR